MTTRRKFLTTAAAGAAAVPLAAPAIAQSTITWRMQTYAGSALAAHVAKPAIDMFNKIAGDRMQIELYSADQLVPTGELFRALQRGTIDAVQSDDDSMASPTEVTVFGGYFPLTLRYSLDVPVLFNQYGLKEIWEEEYAKVGVKHVSAGSWDPCHFATKEPIHSLADLEGKRIFTFPTAGRFLTQFGVVPVNLPWEDIEVALQTGELDGVAWSGITEDYTVGWADVTNYFLTNNISGAWIGHFFANMEKWNDLPEDLQTLFVWQVAVSPEARGRGIAGRLVVRLLESPTCRDVKRLRATITPSNTASWRLFGSIADSLDAPLNRQLWLDAEADFDGDHEAEFMITIGPFPSLAQSA